MGSKIKALLVMVSDSASQLSELLKDCGLEVLTVSSCMQARDVLNSESPVQVVFTDAELPDGKWSSVLEEAVQSRGTPKVVVCVRLGEETLWCDVLERGGYDLLVEPYQQNEVRWIVEGATRGRESSQQ